MSSTAKSLIDAAKARASRVPVLSDYGVKLLREVLAYNDEQLNSQAKVSMETMCAALKEHAGWCGGRTAIDRVCREQLGRASFGRKGDAQ